MKKSNKLLIGLLVMVLAAMVGFNTVLKSEYRKIDFGDPLHGYAPTAVAPFKVLVLQGGLDGLLQVQPGRSAAVRIREDDADKLTWRSRGDTLIVTYRPEAGRWPSHPGDAFDARPAAYLIAPSVQAIIANGVNCKLEGLDTDRLTLVQDNAGVFVANSTIGTLTATARRGSHLQTGPSNRRIGAATVTVRDSSGFVVDRDIFGAVSLRADSTVMVRVPGSLLRKL